MLRTSILATTVFLAILMALAACTTATPEPSPTETPDPRATAATPELLPDTPEAEATATPTSPPEPTTTVIPTAAPAATPTSQPTAEPTATRPPDGRLAPIRLQDSQALVSSLSQAEIACIGDVPETLDRVNEWPSQESKDEMRRLIGCLSDETLARLFLSGIMTGPEPLSLETSDCVRAAFTVIDPQEVMTAGLEDDPERARRAMAASAAAATTTTACLNDQEWERSVWVETIGPQERADQQCLMAALGGPGEMAAAMRAAQEGDSAGLEGAAAACGLDREPATAQGPATPTPMPTGTAPEPATALTIIVAEVPADIPEYSRSEWKHWTDEDGDCQDARQEVLVAESLVEVTFQTDRECRVAAGRWYGAYTGAFVEDPGNLDIDHLVPLKNAHQSGGWRWPPEKKEQYANDLSDPDHLIAVTAGANRSKGARGPEEWAPPDSGYWCEYATDWAEVKYRWLLTMTPRESEIVMDMLYTCLVPPEVEVLTGMVVRTGVDKPTPEPEDPVYGSCEEAEAAGEERVQGSQGRRTEASRRRWCLEKRDSTSTETGMEWCARDDVHRRIR